MDRYLQKRFLAAFIDLFCVPFVIYFVIGYLNRGNPPLYITVAVNIFWLAVRDLFNGAGPGKRLCSLRVIRRDTGQPLQTKDIPHALLRNILLYIPLVLILGYIIEIVMLTAKKERLGDIWAKTEVVDVSPKTKDM